MRMGRRRHARLDRAVIFAQQRVERVFSPARGAAASAPAAASSAASAPARPVRIARRFVSSRFLKDSFSRVLLEAFPQPGCSPPFRHAIQHGVTREEHQHAVRHVLAPRRERGAEIVLVRELRGGLERSVEFRAPRSCRHRPGPHLRVHVHAVRRLHANRKRHAQLGRERVERGERPGGEHDRARPARTREIPERQRRVERPQRERRRRRSFVGVAETAPRRLRQRSLHDESEITRPARADVAARVPRGGEEHLGRLERGAAHASRRGRLRVVRLLHRRLTRVFHRR